MIQPTPYAGLNAVLDHLLDGARSRLGDNFIGAYLQGSFAVGDFTPYSDCDFVVVTRRDVTRDELPALQALHAEIHGLPVPYWYNALEGSYAPAGVIRRWSTTPRDPPGEPRPDDWADPGTSGSPPLAYPFWYLDHGSKTLVRSEHDNTRVVRWCLREKGVVLAGPHPAELVDPITPDELRAEVRATMGRCLAVGLEPMHLVAWQAFWVGLFCRILHTLRVGEVTSKKAAMTWAQGALDPQWRGLIARAQALKKGASEAELPADPAEIAATRAFVAYAVAFADRAG
jgi:hypothetical protein